MILAPPGSRKEDVVCVIPGLPTPLVVRPVVREVSERTNLSNIYSKPKKDGQYRVEGKYLLVGECYVHGIMDGEVSMTETQRLVLC